MKHRLVRGKFTIATTLVVIAAAGCELAPPPLAVAPVAYFEGRVEDGRLVSLRTCPPTSTTTSIPTSRPAIPMPWTSSVEGAMNKPSR